MSDSPATILAAYLVSSGYGYEPGLTSTTTPDPLGNGDWPLFIGMSPDGDGIPDNMITVFDFKGTIEHREVSTGDTIEHPAVQIRLRAIDYPTGYTKIAELAALLDGISRNIVQLDASTYRIESASRGQIVPLGTDPEAGRMIRTSGDRRRHQFTLNALLTLSEL